MAEQLNKVKMAFTVRNQKTLSNAVYEDLISKRRAMPMK